jgi:hypothetical protein
MRHFIRLISALGAMLALTGCATLFHDNFNFDTAAMRPSTSPAGPPVGDSVQILGGTSGTAVVTSAGITPASGNSLLYSYSPTVSTVWFNGIETAEVPQEYWVAWSGLESGNPPSLNFTAGNYSTGLAKLKIQNHRFVAGGRAFGSVERGQVHTVVMHVDNRTRTYTVSIYQPHRAVLNSGNQPIAPLTSVPYHAVRLSMGYEIPNFSPISASYKIDDIVISKNRSDMPR